VSMNLTQSIANKGETLFAKISRRLKARRDAARSAEVSAILRRPAPFDFTGPQTAFTNLSERWGPRPEYGYDPVSTWKRATSRSLTLLDLQGIRVPGKSVLDVGAGDGMLGAALAAFGHSVSLVDQEDWRHEQAKSVAFKAADCCRQLPYESNSFDLVCSYNSFEHFPTPDTVYAEMVRVTKPGGWIHAEFNPLYSSPWGLHAYRTLRMPYTQFLFSEEFILQKLDELGIWDLGKKRVELQFLNKWRLSQFDSLWARPGCVVVTNHRMIDSEELQLVLEYPEAFQGRELTVEDLTVSGVTVSIRKECGQ
jgi:ubiquinone/menaquinone biosynthesis C-methylase UbiE